MEPTLKRGSLIIARRSSKPRVGDAIMFKHDGKEKVKRISRLEKETFYATGDNKSFSSDSRDFGNLPIDAIIGKVIWPRK